MRNLLQFVICIVGIVVMGLGAHTVYANGSDERYTDGILVGLSSAPKSPLVGEKVGMLFYLQEAEGRKYITSIPQAKVVIEAFIIDGHKPGDILFESPDIDSSIGSFNLDYQFDTEGIYDIHVLFTADGKNHNVGFTKQIRVGAEKESGSLIPIVGMGIVGFALGYLVSRLRSGKEGNAPPPKVA